MKRFIHPAPVPKITLKKIASDLNLSMAAVSAALGTESTTKVSAKTAERVQAHARKLNYRPSLLGKAMRSQRLHQIGILIESDFGQRRHLPIIEMPAIFGLNDFLRNQDWQLHLIDDSGDRVQLPRYLRERFLDGLVVVSGNNHWDTVIRADVKRFSIPAVFLNAADEYNSVSIDDRLGGAMATRHLVDLGHRKLIYVGSASAHASVTERIRGYREVLESEGLKAPVHLLKMEAPEDDQVYERRVALAYRDGQRFVDSVFIKDRPTGIICYDDRIAMILMKSLHEAGFAVPEDVSIVGFNDMPFVDILPTSLTTIHTDFYKLGQLAGQLLLDLIQKRKSRLPSPIIKPNLVVRQSTSPVLHGKKSKS